MTPISVSSRHFIKGGQTRVLEILRRGGINHQAVRQNKVKIQGWGNQDLRGGGGGGGMKPCLWCFTWILFTYTFSGECNSFASTWDVMHTESLHIILLYGSTHNRQLAQRK